MDLSAFTTKELLAEIRRRGDAKAAKKPKRLFDHAALLRLLRYDKETGQFFNITKLDASGNAVPVGSLGTRGYIKVYVYGRYYSAHRLAMFYETGTWPEHDVDHINGNRVDNRLENLRCVTRQQNSQNRIKVYGKSKFRGVCWCKQQEKWKAYASVNGKMKVFGYYQSEEMAGVAAKAGRDLLFTHHTT